MKSLLLTIIFFFFFITGCVTTTVEPTERHVVDFEVHFQSNFNDDEVLLKIDRNNVYVGKLNTEQVWSLAKILKIQALSGTHSLYLNVNNTEFKQTEFDLQDSLYILIRYTDPESESLDRDEAIDIEFTTIAPYYD